MTSQINLVDAALLPTPALIGGRAAAVIVAVALLGVAVHGGMESAQLRAALAASPAQATLQATSTAIAAADAASAPAGGVAAQTQQLQRNLALRDALAQAHRLPNDSARVLQQVMAALPESLWLTEIDLRGSQSIRIAGGALDASALAGFSAGLARIDALKGTPVLVLQLEPQVRADGASVDASADALATSSSTAAVAATVAAAVAVPTRRARQPYTFALASGDAAEVPQ